MRTLALMVGCIGVTLWSGLAAERSRATPTACHDLFRVKQILPFRGFSSDPAPIAVGRFNADPRDDIALVRPDGLRVMLAGADGGFRLPGSAVAHVPIWSLLAGELTGDRRTDLVAASLDGRVLVLPGDGLGSFALGPPASAPNPFLRAVGDLNADAKSDVVLTTDGPGGAHLRVLLGDGAGALAESAAFPVAANSRAAAVIRDFDGDARPDLLLGGPAGADRPATPPGRRRRPLPTRRRRGQPDRQRRRAERGRLQRRRAPRRRGDGIRDGDRRSRRRSRPLRGAELEDPPVRWRLQRWTRSQQRGLQRGPPR